jgi:hypothetical protein
MNRGSPPLKRGGPAGAQPDRDAKLKVVNGASITRHATDTSFAPSRRLLTIPSDQKLLIATLRPGGAQP